MLDVLGGTVKEVLLPKARSQGAQGHPRRGAHFLRQKKERGEKNWHKSNFCYQFGFPANKSFAKNANISGRIFHTFSKNFAYFRKKIFFQNAKLFSRKFRENAKIFLRNAKFFSKTMSFISATIIIAQMNSHALISQCLKFYYVI